MSAELQFTIFYVAFLLILTTVAIYIPVEIITGITPDQVNALKENVSLPAEPGIDDYFLFPFRFIYSILNKAIILLSVSTAHQFIALILTPLTIGFVFVIADFIRG